MKPFSIPSLLCGGTLAVLALACSSSNPDPTSGATSTRSKGRVLVSSETGTDVYVLDLEQAIVETQSKSVANASEMIISPEGKYAFMVQASGNRVDIFKMGTSAVASSSEEADSGLDEHGHDHGKPRLAAEDEHDHGSSESSSESSESSSTSTSSVDQVDIAITGEGLGQVVARGKWVAIQFAEEVVVIAEDDFENSNSINQSIVNTIVAPTQIKGIPGVPMDEEHIAIGNWVFEIENNTTGTNLSSGKNASANALLSSNVLSATRSGEGTALYGTDQGLLVVGKHTESGNVEWEDLMVSYPTVPEAQIFLAEEHDHDEEEGEEEHGDEHEEVIEHRSATQWATMDGLGHAFAHLTHENHSAGMYLVEAEGLEEDSDLTNVFEYLVGTSSASERPVAMSIVVLHEEEEHHDEVEGEEEEEEHTDTKYLLILMSSGNLRVHDAANEGAFVKTIDALITPVTDFHAGENNLPGMTAGLGKVFVGDPSTNAIHQIDLKSLKEELSWSLGTKPNRLLLMGESTLGESSSQSHDHD
jgi:hypothetical protein